MATREQALAILKSRVKEGNNAKTDVPAKELTQDQYVDKLIQERKPYTIRDYIQEVSANPPDDIGQMTKNIFSAAQLLGEPFRRAEAGVSNVGMSMQSGEFSPRALGKEFMSGISGQRMGEAGDIMRNVGAPEPVASTVGFVASLVAPIKAINQGIKSVSSISKASDKGLKIAGKHLIKGSDEAVSKLNVRLNQAYNTPVKIGDEVKTLNDVAVSGDKVLDDLIKLPKSVINHIENELGQNIDDLLEAFTVKKARKLKGILGELKPNAFSKEAKGAQELIVDKNIIKAYGNIKQSMQKALGKQGKSILDADESFVETINASRYIKRKAMDPILLQPTRTSKVAKGVENIDDVSTRMALSTLKKAGGDAKKNINKAMREIELFNRRRKAQEVLELGIKSAVFGGAAGAVGGRALRALDNE